MGWTPRVVEALAWGVHPPIRGDRTSDQAARSPRAALPSETMDGAAATFYGAALISDGGANGGE